jgi:hypothetical protein
MEDEMHPEITSQLAALHIAELRRQADQERMLPRLRVVRGGRLRRRLPRARPAPRGRRPATA